MKLLKDESTAFALFFWSHPTALYEKISPFSIFTVHNKPYVCHLLGLEYNSLFLNYFFDVQLDAECNNRPIVFLAFAGTMSWLGPQREFEDLLNLPPAALTEA